MGRVWTIEERQKQADRIRSQKPWLKSTGPRSTRGKLTSSQNATRHGGYSAEFKMMCLYLRMQKYYIATLRFYLKHDLFNDESVFKISGNELNENAIKSIQNATDSHIKLTVKNVVLLRRGNHKSLLQPQSHKAHKGSQNFSSPHHCEERSDEAIQNACYTHPDLPHIFSTQARNDNSLISYNPNRHPSESWDPESTPIHKPTQSKELCDSSCPLCLCGQRLSG